VTAAKKKVSDENREQREEDTVEISSSAMEAKEKTKDSKKKDGHKSSMSKKDLNKKLGEVEKEKNEFSDRLLRNMAEFDNYRKRVAREKEDLIKYGNEKFAFDILSVMDNFERSLEQARKSQEVEPVIEGIEMIRKQFVSALEKFNVKPFESVGEPFDPERHEAMAQQEHNEYEENTVIEEYQKGYFLKEKLLRPARVIVSKSTEKE
jgi:molecular chaperone GrpE